MPDHTGLLTDASEGATTRISDTGTVSMMSSGFGDPMVEPRARDSENVEPSGIAEESCLAGLFLRRARDRGMYKESGNPTEPGESLLPEGAALNRFRFGVRFMIDTVDWTIGDTTGENSTGSTGGLS